MSVPHTSTHSVSLRENQDLEDISKSYRVKNLKYPVQCIVNTKGSSNPKAWEYGGFRDFDDLLQMSEDWDKCPSGVSDFPWERWDDVEWTDVPEGWQPSIPDYAYETKRKLLNVREALRLAKEHKANQLLERQRYTRELEERRTHPQNFYAKDEESNNALRLSMKMDGMSLGKRRNDSEGGERPPKRPFWPSR
jgi:hypothetical protein